MKLSYPLAVSDGVYSLVLIIFVGGWLRAIPRLFSSIFVTEFGIETHGSLVRRQKFGWDEIVAVSKSSFPTRSGFTDIISNRGDKITVMGSMTGYSELLELILSKAPNVKNELPSDSWGWHFVSGLRWLAISFGFFLTYVFVRWLFRS